MQICAITVAYNNPNELVRLLCSLQTQQGLNGLIVVDNSRDTCASENEAIFRRHSSCYSFARYLRAEENAGSAGGFSCGMKIAHKKGFDWVWLLDQDGTVELGCLASLLQNAGSADILCPKIIDIDCPSVVSPQSGATQNFWGRLVWRAFTESRNISFFGTHGVLISKKVLDRVGYYDGRHFFVGSEDSDYAFRSTNEDMIIRLVSEAEARHPDIFCRSSEKRTDLVNDGFVDSVFSEHANPGLLSRLALVTSESLQWLLPEHLGYMSGKLVDAGACRTSRALASLSYAYLATKRLTTLQLAAAVCYSSLIASIRKIVSGDRISLKKTVAMYAICMRSKLTRKWPFESVQQFCLDLSTRRI
jgi:glycosyltransferase involved in cell wall biosynthesis